MEEVEEEEEVEGEKTATRDRFLLSIDPSLSLSTILSFSPSPPSLPSLLTWNMPVIEGSSARAGPSAEEGSVETPAVEFWYVEKEKESKKKGKVSQRKEQEEEESLVFPPSMASSSISFLLSRHSEHFSLSSSPLCLSRTHAWSLCDQRKSEPR